MVVGDDDQSIYRFQGANIENMLDFTTQYPDAKIIVLDKNYRSQQAILDSAQSLIEYNSERLISRIPKLEKNLYSQRNFDVLIPSLYLAQSDLDEQHYIIQEIEKLLNI
jgi:DNA helicase-2/ATP-dependent DNA helicase PcrA